MEQSKNTDIYTPDPPVKLSDGLGGCAYSQQQYDDVQQELWRMQEEQKRGFATEEAYDNFWKAYREKLAELERLSKLREAQSA
jgi:hypothetical protein